ncbi:MAG: 8.8 kDa unknown protein [Plant associated waikavirus 2]|nr:MAG: 8.8 kDa unknown protein [Plant associated waikavirus 2]
MGECSHYGFIVCKLFCVPLWGHNGFVILTILGLHNTMDQQIVVKHLCHIELKLEKCCLWGPMSTRILRPSICDSMDY